MFQTPPDETVASVESATRLDPPRTLFAGSGAGGEREPQLDGGSAPVADEGVGDGAHERDAQAEAAAGGPVSIPTPSSLTSTVSW